MNIGARLILVFVCIVISGAACTDTDLSTPEPTLEIPTIRGSPTSAPETLTPTSEPPQSILFIGNSLIYYNNGVEKHFELLANSADPPKDVSAERVSEASAPLEQLWETSTIHEVINSGGFDIVVLQETLQFTSSWKESKSVDSFLEFAHAFNDEINRAGAETVLFMAWPLDQSGLIPATNEENELAHGEVAQELDLLVAPVALAMQKTIKEYPEIDLYADEIHPSIYGTYLAAAVVFATIFDESPIGLSYLPDGIFPLSNGEFVSSISVDEALILQQIAWETYQEYKSGSVPETG